MKTQIGVDAGSISTKLVAAIAPDDFVDLARNFEVSSGFWLVPGSSPERAGAALVVSQYRRGAGSPLRSALDLLDEFRRLVPEEKIGGIRVTGSGGRRVAETLGVPYENEFRAMARGIGAMYPEARTIFEMGGESSKYLLLEDSARGGEDGQEPSLGIADYSTSGECAAGTGSFIDQQATRLRYQVEEIGAIVAQAKTAARIAGRCSVFAKSDMIHAQQKGYGTGEVLKGLCEAVARNFKSNIVKGKKIVPPVLFLGGVSQNAGVAQAMAAAFRLGPGELIVPELYAWMGALGAALLEGDEEVRAGNVGAVARMARGGCRDGVLRPDAFTDTGRSALSESDRFAQDDRKWAGDAELVVSGAASACEHEHEEPCCLNSAAVTSDATGAPLCHPERSEGSCSYVSGLPDEGVSSANQPLSLANVLLLRDHPDARRTEPLPELGAHKLPVYLGIDIGSVSTNLALIDEDGRLLHGIYLRTAGRPIEVVGDGLREIDELFGSRIEIRGVGTTGSGRELIGELVGADTVNDEITAHKTGAMYVHETLVRRLPRVEGGGTCNVPLPTTCSGDGVGDVDTIFEIGGQDSKFISIDRGIVVDFAMNEACAAGTGSFLEEQAERVGIQIKDEFARLALASKAPVRLGERCTVFMERDVTAALGRGASLEDVIGGLAYSVALNYLNRVVRGRKIGDVIYFQGGTAYNDSVAAAFSTLLGKPVIVPPHNGIIGAIGMALIAQEVTKARGRSMGQARAAVERLAENETASSFRGFDLSAMDFETREFVCKACSNYCDMKEITVEGRKTYWGDKCSDKFRKRAKTDRQPVIEDLLALHDRELLAGYSPRDGDDAGSTGEGRTGRNACATVIGIPQAMYFYDEFPFWRTYLETLGFEIVLSPPTDRYLAARGTELSVAEPCFPVQIAHGHVHALFDGQPGRPRADYVLLPNVMDRESPPSETASYLCPWNQTLPFVVRAAPELGEHAGKILAPTVRFRAGHKFVARQLAEYFRKLDVGRRQSDAAVEAAYEARAKFKAKLQEAGRAACARLEEAGEPAVLLVGRPYNLYDRNGNCDIPRKLRDLYGVNVLPLDFLPIDHVAPDDLHPNMYWNSGRRILAAGRFAGKHPRMHVIYITNFKCGPDSFIKHYLREAAGAPFLVLQFDGHGNDAGYLTRCEAYLDSKGILRCAK
jgi:activator of 2-hydroxyglutaryl-CoA dehydratase/predicted nucleotide-binding protein (sugar kinase/HSP70/actin superfamily)